MSHDVANLEFTAYTLTVELDLNKLATHLGIARKYRWEEPMQLSPTTLQPLETGFSEEQQVYLYYFGGVVFINCSDSTIREFCRKMEAMTDAFRTFAGMRYQEQYLLRIDEDQELSITDNYAVMPRCDSAFLGIVAFVIAKSVALERIEEQVDTVLDEMEDVIMLLGKGKLGISDRRLAQLASKILNFKYSSITYIMVLDKPDITWDNQQADHLYLTMANLFELDQRYQMIRHKSETLMDITAVFSGLSHARRSSRLELVIILLIFIEIVIYLFEIL